MPFEHFDRFFTFAAVGLGLLLTGGLNCALGRGGRRVALRAVATLAACGAVLAGFAYLTRPELAVRAALILTGVLLVAGLFGSAWFGRQVAALLTLLRRPALRWGLVALGGAGVAFAAGFAFDRADEAVADQGMKNLEMVVGRPPVQPSPRTHAATDRGHRIVLKEPIEPRAVADLVSPEEKALKNFPYHDQVIRRGGATDHSNCHGWVFTGGKFLLGPDDVEAILQENGYHDTPEPHPGDLVIYRQNGVIAHSAVVRYVTEGQPVLVEGKWGTMGVFLHPADKSFYGTDYTFYRSARAGHLLTGVESSPTPVDGPHGTE